MKLNIQFILCMIALGFLISFGSMAQTQSQKFGANPTSIAPSAVLEMESTNKGVLFPRVTLTSTSDLTTIASPATGLTVFNTASAGTSPNNVTPGYYYWNGSKWIKMAIETPFAKTVYVNATSPTTATIFEENNPPATNNDALKATDVNLYIGSDGSTWTYNTSTSAYNTFTVPASTPFNLAGTTTDAGSNKTSAIWRSGSIGIGINSPKTLLDIAAPSGNSNITVGTVGTATTEEVSLNLVTKYDRTNAFASSANRGWQIGARGDAIVGTAANSFSQKNAFHASYWNGSALTNSLTILPSGNMGIKGITNPQQALDINGTALFRINDNSAPQILLGFSNGHQVRSRHSGLVSASNAIDFNVWRATDLVTTGAAVQVMTLRGDGRVGIGTNAPLSTVDVNTSLSATATINADANMLKLSRPTTANTKIGNVAQFDLGSYAVLGTDALTRLDLGLNNLQSLTTSPVMTWQGNGNVGIGTTAPTTTLDVKNTNTTAFQSTINASSDPAALGGTGFNNDNPDIVKASSGIQFLGWNGKKEGGIFRQTGSADKSHLLFTVNTTNDVALTINESRNVGIGTRAPSQRLHIKGTNAQPATTGTVSNAIVRIDGSSSHALDIGTYTDAPYGSYLQSVTTTDLATKLPLVLNPTGGNVGIGINNPAHKLSVLGNARIQPNSSNNGTGEPVWFEMYGKASGSANTQVGGIKLGWYDSFGGIEIVRPDNAIGVGLAFNYANSSGTTTEGFRLSNSGNVGIGTTAPTQRLQVVGNIDASGTVSASGTTLTSDARLKSNIVNLSQGLSKIMQLNPVNYDKKEALDSAATINENGFIAQELQKIMPELVSEGKDKDKLLSVNYTAIIPVLTKAVQEQQVIIEENKATIQKQQEQINELKVLVEKLLNKK